MYAVALTINPTAVQAQLPARLASSCRLKHHPHICSPWPLFIARPTAMHSPTQAGSAPNTACCALSRVCLEFETGLKHFSSRRKETKVAGYEHFSYLSSQPRLNTILSSNHVLFSFPVTTASNAPHPDYQEVCLLRN